MVTATKPMQEVRGWKGNAVNRENGFQSSRGEGRVSVKRRMTRESQWQELGEMGRENK